MVRFAKLAAVAAVMISAQASAQSMTSGFGGRTDPFNGKRANHAGVDIAAPTGTPVYATGNGYIGRSRWAGGYGNLVEINHGNGYQTRFGHLSQRYVAEGQYVQRGQLVGLIGSTGRSTGPHLHYEVRLNGVAQDPSPYIRGMRGTVSSHTVAMGGPAEGR
jgi:murein DD-endopeptidase MepM/ murein hydrolase activator NlpD